jgi:hypothetical protein
MLSDAITAEERQREEAFARAVGYSGLSRTRGRLRSHTADTLLASGKMSRIRPWVLPPDKARPKSTSHA